MTSDSPSVPSPAAKAADWVAPLLAVLAIQIAASCLSRLVPTIAPSLGPRIGWPATRVGYLASVLTIGSVLFLLLGLPLVRRYGPMRSLQLGLGLGACGALLCALPLAGAALLGSLLMGLGYAPSTSAANDVLHRHAPRRHMGLVFSIKQAGVPIGGVLAGLALPAATEAWGVPGAVSLSAGVALLVLLGTQPLRPRIDEARDPAQPVGWRSFLSLANAKRPLAMLAGVPALRRMGATGLCLGFGQAGWFAFFVTYLVESLHWSLTRAGAAFALMQAVSAFGRPLMGWLADRTGSGLRVLRWAAVSSALSTFALALASPAWPPAAMLVLAVVAGCTVSSWNGVQMAEVARLSAPGAIAESTAGATLLLFVGFVSGPATFGLAVAAGASHGLAFGIIGVVTSLALLPLWLRDAPRAATPH